MKKIFKIFLRSYLKFFAKLFLFFRKPCVIAIAGSSNQYFIKSSIKQALSIDEPDPGVNNFNTDIGLPLAVLGLPSGFGNYRDWLPIMARAAAAPFKRKSAPSLIVTLGTSRSNDMEYLLRIVKPCVAIISDITQKHLEGYADREELIQEYEYLSASLKPDALLILNHDNPRVLALKDRSRAKISTFGFEPGADWRIEMHSGAGLPGISYTLWNGGKSRKIELDRFGRHHAAADCVAKIVKHYADN